MPGPNPREGFPLTSFPREWYRDVAQQGALEVAINFSIMNSIFSSKITIKQIFLCFINNKQIVCLVANQSLSLQYASIKPNLLIALKKM